MIFIDDICENYPWVIMRIKTKISLATTICYWFRSIGGGGRKGSLYVYRGFFLYSRNTFKKNGLLLKLLGNKKQIIR